MISENILQFIWQHALLETNRPLQTVDGQEINVLKKGILNHDAGPDFLHAQLKIGSTIWAGNIEVHVRSSDWIKHKHAQDKNYEKLILHIVYEDDVELGLNFPTLILKDSIPKSFLNKYENLIQLKKDIPCHAHINGLEPIYLKDQMTRALIGRLEKKGQRIKELLEQYKNDWEQVFYIILARSFGLRVNAEAFEQLAHKTSFKLFHKHHKLRECEAILFGQSGMLDISTEHAYQRHLKKEYEHLKNLHSLKSIDPHLWKFLRLRPANFPSIRLAQFAQLLHSSRHLFSRIIEANSLENFYSIFELGVSEFWQTHFSFQSDESKHSLKKMGASFKDILLINAVVPTLFDYGINEGLPRYKEKALALLEEIKAEKNAVSRQLKNYGFQLKSAADSQALLELKSAYCDQQRCLNCGIGYQILKT